MRENEKTAAIISSAPTDKMQPSETLSDISIAQEPLIFNEKILASNKFIRKIGSTSYEVSMNFSQTSKENIDDKILRLIGNDYPTIHNKLAQ